MSCKTPTIDLKKSFLDKHGNLRQKGVSHFIESITGVVVFESAAVQKEFEACVKENKLKRYYLVNQ